MDLVAKASGGFSDWIMERKNRRSIPHRLEKCGMTPIRNSAAESGLWVIKGARQVIYVQKTLSPADQLRAAEARAKV